MITVVVLTGLPPGQALFYQLGPLALTNLQREANCGVGGMMVAPDASLNTGRRGGAGSGLWGAGEHAACKEANCCQQERRPRQVKVLIL